MSKIKSGTNDVTQTMPVTLLGTQTDKKPNFITLAWVTRVNNNPPLFAVAVNKAHQTNKSIRLNTTFSINIPSQEMIIETDYCGLISAKRNDKSQICSMFFMVNYKMHP